ncbi:MAG: hypothetical protein LBK26_00420 [Rickettsiales bacterium]|jgi:dTMP kinase|nr:hypothetical protein [Rickettsiales bacterium]
MKNAMIIAVEGADRAGKATQVRNIMNYLHGQNIMAQTLDFPQYNAYFGKFAKDYLNGKYGHFRDLPAEYAMMPYALDRLQHQPLIKEWLDSGAWIVLDRYSYSNIFSVAKCPHENWEEKINYLEDLEFNQLGLLRPDYNFYLYLPPEISYQLRNIGGKAADMGKTDIHEADFSLQRNTTEAYKYLTERRPQEWSFIDQMQGDVRLSADQVFVQKIQPIIDRLTRARGE